MPGRRHLPRRLIAEGTTFAGLADSADCPAPAEAVRAPGWEGERLEGILSRNLLRFLRESLPA